MSLNNRISIRDAYGSRGGAVESQVMTSPSSSSARSDALTDQDAIQLERQKHGLEKHSLDGINGTIVSCKSRDVLSLRTQFSHSPRAVPFGMTLIGRI